MRVLHSIKGMIEVLKKYDQVFLMIGFASRAQYKSLDTVEKAVNRIVDIGKNTLILYGGDDARNKDERGLGHLVAQLKHKYGCDVMGVVCDRDDYEDFIDFVVRVRPQYDAWGIKYTGYMENGKKLFGNTRYYLAPTVRKYVTRVIICGGGGFGLDDVKLVVEHTQLPYTYVKCSARYPRVYNGFYGPIDSYFRNTRHDTERSYNGLIAHDHKNDFIKAIVEPNPGSLYGHKPVP
jgi:hypothetical protein